MKVPCSTALVVALSAAVTFAMPAQAASGSLDSLSASATEVVAGSWVDFSVSYSVIAGAYSYGGSNSIEPEPQEGYQSWDVNWYYVEAETLNSASVQIDGQGTTEILNLSPGSSHSSTWSASIRFDTPGAYTVSAGGNWAGEFMNYYSSESAYRNCYVVDPDYGGSLTCDSWTWQYADYGDRYGIGGDFSPLSLNINVTAVPEPGTLALWLAGVALLASRARRGA